MSTIGIDFFINSRTQPFIEASCREAQETVTALRRRGGHVQLRFHEAHEDVELQLEQIRSQALLRGAGETHRLLLILPLRLQTVAAIARGIIPGSPEHLSWAFLHQRLPADIALKVPELRQRPVYCVGADQEKMGELQARLLQSLFWQDDGHPVDVVYLQGPMHSPATARRSAGFRAQLARTPRFQILTQMLFGEWSTKAALESLDEAGVCRLLPFTRAAVAHNDEMALGLREYCRANGRPDVPSIGIDGLDTVGKRRVDEGELTATVVQPLCIRQAFLMHVKRVMPELLTEAERRKTPDVAPCGDTCIAPEPYPVLDHLDGTTCQRSVA